MTQIHNIKPLFNSSSAILILGSFPSVKSREGRFFYHHPQNRFWRVLSAVMQKDTPETVGQKREFLLNSRIALWDVVCSCDIVNSSDSSIKNVLPNDLDIILSKADIKGIFTNGGKAHTLYQRYCLPAVKRKDVPLPSTSPANAAYSLDALIEKWKIIREYF